MNLACSVGGCDRRHKAKGLCALHYTRVNATGSTGDPRPLHMAPLCCVCTVPVPKPTFGGGVECQACFRPCGPNFADMRAAYRARGIT